MEHFISSNSTIILLLPWCALLCPRLGRWTAVDPLATKFAPESAYCYGHNNPVVWKDPDWMDPLKHEGDINKNKTPEKVTPAADNTRVNNDIARSQTQSTDTKQMTGVLPEVQVTAKASAGAKAQSFFKGLVKGLVISVVATVAITALVATGGAAAILGYGLIAAGGASLIVGAANVISGKNVFSGTLKSR